MSKSLQPNLAQFDVKHWYELARNNRVVQKKLARINLSTTYVIYNCVIYC